LGKSDFLFSCGVFRRNVLDPAILLGTGTRSPCGIPVADDERRHLFFAFPLAAQNFFIRSLMAFLAAAVILRRRRRRMARLTVSTGADSGPPECPRRCGNHLTVVV
jgi:hypothetical protein